MVSFTSILFLELKKTSKHNFTSFQTQFYLNQFNKIMKLLSDNVCICPTKNIYIVCFKSDKMVSTLLNVIENKALILSSKLVILA